MKARIGALLLVAAMGSAAAVVTQARTEAQASFVRNSYYAAGERIDVPEGVNGDVVVAGRTVTVARPVTGDILAAGWRVTVTGDAADDVRLAGNEVLVNAQIAGDLTAAGRDLTLGPGSRVLGNGWLTGEKVRINGTVERELRIAAAHVALGGEIQQPTRIVAETLEVLPTARIMAPLVYEGATPAQIAAGALLTQVITYRNIPSREARQARWPSGLSSVLFAIHLFVGGLLLFLFVPRFATTPVEMLRTQPWRSLLVGVALTAGVPFVALLLFVSFIGLPVGLSLAALYAVALFLAVLTTAFTIGNVEAGIVHAAPVATRSRQVALLLAGVVTLAILRSVPVLGAVVVPAAALFGFGALGLWMYRGPFGFAETAPRA